MAGGESQGQSEGSVRWWWAVTSPAGVNDFEKVHIHGQDIVRESNYPLFHIRQSCCKRECGGMFSLPTMEAFHG